MKWFHEIPAPTGLFSHSAVRPCILRLMTMFIVNRLSGNIPFVLSFCRSVFTLPGSHFWASPAPNSTAGPEARLWLTGRQVRHPLSPVDICPEYPCHRSRS